MACKSYQSRTGEHVCDRCGYRWDADDDAPECKTDKKLQAIREAKTIKDREIKTERNHKGFSELRNILNHD